MASRLEESAVDEIQLAEVISPQVNESPEPLAPTMSSKHSKAQLAAIMVMLYVSVNVNGCGNGFRLDADTSTVLRLPRRS